MLRNLVGYISKRAEARVIVPQDEKIIWKFNSDKVVKEFYCFTDADLGGNSDGKFTLNSQNKALFSGTLSTKIKPGMQLKYTGFCSLRSIVPRRFPRGEILQDWSNFDAIEFRVRGDGRAYLVNLHHQTFRPDDLFQAFMFTRGGPDWESVRIPFSNFFLANSGYMQDKDADISYAIARIRTIGLLLADRVDGPFQLEIDNIKVVRSAMHITRGYHQNLTYKVNMDHYRKTEKYMKKNYGPVSG
ncbi:uncharacterized protein TRIADDRAFT_57282 [Trichoplax adhaerens]|uniref:NADH:ubiquinone oxidoreductase intermediate-associated protein 30 domain-containing protein n=1 Tax=Trichoplax adhaerens TaxID=10228 RepID=B3RZ06_TRIAD|nr:hypothetical protein TRIADDRAFT_57282 [Trichoplax adhaerens]EDV23761.1 hypothetical protein TRIADDRAFT_57282 [Trichoplax adhaerens]|eukprot:XP_002113287.1 hypothetical protein TRIADDRAFT_57282 [Trichoplax adhaerens]